MPVFHPRAKHWQVEEEPARPGGYHYQPLLFAFLRPIHPTPDPLASKGPTRVEVATSQRRNCLFPLISRQRGDLAP